MQHAPQRSAAQNGAYRLLTLLLTLLSLVFCLITTLNVIQLANTGPNLIALRPSGWIRTNRGWSTVRDEHLFVHQGIYLQIYAIVRPDGSVYLVNTWDADPWVVDEVHALWTKEQKPPEPSSLLLAKGTRR